MSSGLTTPKAEEGSDASTEAEGNPEQGAASSAGSTESSAGGQLDPQPQTTTPADVSGGNNTSTTSATSGFAAASSTGRDRVGPPDRNDDNGLFKLGKTFLGLTFQAALALMIYRKQPQQGDSSSANPSSVSSLSSILITWVGATTLFGFAFTMSGMMLQKHHQNVANFCSYAGIFLGALGFFFMMDIFAGKGLDWLVWAVGSVLLLVFAYTLCREMQSD